MRGETAAPPTCEAFEAVLAGASLPFVQVLLDAIPAPIFFKDANGVYRGCNAAFERFVGKRREEIVGRTVEELWPAALAAVYRAADDALFRDPGVQVYEARVAGPGGELRDVVFHKATFAAADGRVAGLVGTYVDVTERKRAEDERERLQERLVASDRLVALGTLAAGLAHEINNPLTFVATNVEWAAGAIAAIEAAPCPGSRCAAGEVHPSLRDARDALADAKEGVARVAGIVRDLGVFSHPGGASSAVDLDDAVRSAANVVGARLVGHELALALARVPPVAADEARLGQVILNLLVNAAQALSPSGGRIRVATSVADDGRVLLEVADDGCGIAADALPRVFDPFYTTKAPGEGTGLGLFVSQRLVREMGGEIAVESAPGRGTTFRVLLRPAAPEDAAPAPDAPRPAAG